MEYPTVAEVIAADQERISFWWHFLPDPKMSAQERVMDLIFKKFNVNGGFVAPELRKKIKRAENPAEVPNMRASKILRLALPVFLSFFLSFEPFKYCPGCPWYELPDMPKPETEAMSSTKPRRRPSQHTNFIPRRPRSHSASRSHLGTRYGVHVQQPRQMEAARWDCRFILARRWSA
jgi:hypothetical protein